MAVNSTQILNPVMDSLRSTSTQAKAHIFFQSLGEQRACPIQFQQKILFGGLELQFVQLLTIEITE
jgi:hypothetical protein